MSVENDPQWKPITKEEYRYHQRVYPIYGAGAGAIFGLIFTLKGRVGRTSQNTEDEK